MQQGVGVRLKERKGRERELIGFTLFLKFPLTSTPNGKDLL